MYFFQSCFERLKSKIVYCRIYKKFNETNFLGDVKNCDFSLRTDNPNQNYGFLINTFINPNKAGLFEGSFSGEVYLTPLPLQTFKFQEELIWYQYNFIQLLNNLFEAC